jgi:hypothetical protein
MTLAPNRPGNDQLVVQPDALVIHAQDRPCGPCLTVHWNG